MRSFVKSTQVSEGTKKQNSKNFFKSAQKRFFGSRLKKFSRQKW
jgi:hypothetical protein